MGFGGRTGVRPGARAPRVREAGLGAVTRALRGPGRREAERSAPRSRSGPASRVPARAPAAPPPRSPAGDAASLPCPGRSSPGSATQQARAAGSRKGRGSDERVERKGSRGRQQLGRAGGGDAAAPSTSGSRAAAAAAAAEESRALGCHPHDRRLPPSALRPAQPAAPVARRRRRRQAERDLERPQSWQVDSEGERARAVPDPLLLSSGTRPPRRPEKPVPTAWAWAG